MQKLSIHGGVPLSGEVRVAGAKNAALPILAATLLTAEPMRISNVPQLNDIRTMVALLKRTGVQAVVGAGEIELDASNVTEPFAPYELVKTMRASILALGPLTAALRRGARVAARRLRDRRAPGGPAHQGPRRHGRQGGDRAGLHPCNGTPPEGARIRMDTVTVTGTENLMMAACLADGETVLENAAREPEVVDLARCLQAMGARFPAPGRTRSSCRASSAFAGGPRRHARSHRGRDLPRGGRGHAWAHHAHAGAGRGARGDPGEAARSGRRD
jgi:UDP-N-acetylglucosamine 1-carboxyvinyltransferase